MKILVSNIGSTSFKFRLFEMDERGERELAAGGADRIGSTGGAVVWQLTGGEKQAEEHSFADHGEAIAHALDKLVADGALAAADNLDAVAFKAVTAGDWEPVSLVTDELMERMEYFVPVAPAHNPPYVTAMRMFRKTLGATPLVAAFEPGFHRTIPPRRRFYAVPMQWAEQYAIKRYGFHGASHRYIATRTAELMGSPARRVISCHLGGSSSICAILGGQSVANSFGLSPQSGLPQSNRAGEFDPFAFSLLKAQAGMDCDEALRILGSESGLAALSGTSGDIRDILEAAGRGDERAKLALELFATAVRDYVGAYLLEMDGADAIVFTGGIGQHNPSVRADICRGMDFAGIALDPTQNQNASGECRIEAEGSSTAIWVMPTNEELIVARQAKELLERMSQDYK